MAEPRPRRRNQPVRRVRFCERAPREPATNPIVAPSAAPTIPTPATVEKTSGSVPVGKYPGTITPLNGQPTKTSTSATPAPVPAPARAVPPSLPVRNAEAPRMARLPTMPGHHSPYLYPNGSDPRARSARSIVSKRNCPRATRGRNQSPSRLGATHCGAIGEDAGVGSPSPVAL
jgi:hypothetical protein